MEPDQTPHGRIALEFAQALIADEFDQAHEMLSSEAKARWDVTALRDAYRNMTEYFEAPPNLAQVMEVMTEWPDKQPGDVGWAYAAIAGEGESEAVTVVISSEGGKHLVRNVEWGRP